MDQKDIELVQHTYARVTRIGPHFAASFYRELFATDPGLRPMFKGDVVVLGEKLMTSLSYIVSGLDEISSILPAVQAMAVRHLDYGVKPGHYPTVGTALLRTLRHELGADFTAEAREAWAKAYRLLSDAMIAAAYGASEDQAASRHARAL